MTGTNDDYSLLNGGTDESVNESTDNIISEETSKLSQKPNEKPKSFMESLEDKASKIADDSESKKKWYKDPNARKPDAKEPSKADAKQA